VSRGAASAVAVDNSRLNAAAIDKLAKEWGMPVKAVVADVFSVREGADLDYYSYDFVYADPPYDFERYDDLLVATGRLPLDDDAIVAVEHRRGVEPFTMQATGLKQQRRAEYGEVWITFFRRDR
jgi:16S rRNA G966 N2-methylase RsmD